MEYEYTFDHAWVSVKPVAKYDILETIEDRITKTFWHKLATNAQATELIIKNKAYSQWDIKEEITGKKYLWVTDQLLTLLHIQGLQSGY